MAKEEERPCWPGTQSSHLLDPQREQTKRSKSTWVSTKAQAESDPGLPPATLLPILDVGTRSQTNAPRQSWGTAGGRALTSHLPCMKPWGSASAPAERFPVWNEPPRGVRDRESPGTSDAVGNTVESSLVLGPKVEHVRRDFKQGQGSQVGSFGGAWDEAACGFLSLLSVSVF